MSGLFLLGKKIPRLLWAWTSLQVNCDISGRWSGNTISSQRVESFVHSDGGQESSRWRSCGHDPPRVRPWIVDLDRAGSVLIVCAADDNKHPVQYTYGHSASCS